MMRAKQSSFSSAIPIAFFLIFLLVSIVFVVKTANQTTELRSKAAYEATVVDSDALLDVAQQAVTTLEPMTDEEIEADITDSEADETPLTIQEWIESYQAEKDLLSKEP